MLRRTVALAVCAAGCEPPAPAVDPAPPHWVYAPAPTAVGFGEPRGRLGRSQPPQLAHAAGIAGAPVAPLRLATPFGVPGPGPARAIVYGLEGDQPAIELIEVDSGRVVWRARPCAGPVVGVTEAATICADASEARGIGHDGKPRGQRAGTDLARTDERGVMAGAGGVTVISADDGEELARVPLPKGIAVETVMASCGDAGRELFASGQDGKLVRIAEARGGPAVSWATPVGTIVELDACAGATILVRVRGAPTAVLAIDRATGAITGRVDGVRGMWRARELDGDRVELATQAGVARWPRTLAGPPDVLGLPPLGELIAERGERRLVRATERTAVVLDRRGVRAYVAFAWLGGALGDTAVLGATWTGSPGEAVRRLVLPRPLRRAVRLPRRVGIALPAELRDLPAVAPLELAAAIGKPDTAMYEIDRIALDPQEPARLYAVTLEHPRGDARPIGIAGVDLGKRVWQWQRGDGCGLGTPVALGVAHDVIACAARTAAPRAATVTATTRDGAARWQWEADNVDALVASGDSVLVHDADRALLLDAATGHVRGHLASDDGAAVRAALVTIEDTTYAVVFERGRLVVRLPGAGMLPVWSLAIDGVIRSIAPSLEAVLVELEDGDAYRIDVRTAAITALPGIGLAWRAQGDLVTGHTAGGPIPGPPAARPVVRPAGEPVRAPTDDRPPLWTPIPPGPPRGDSFQYTLYDRTGGLRARNDYALAQPIAPATERGPAGSLLVVASGPGLREVLVLDPRTGAPLRRVQLPDDAVAGMVFGTVVDGTPVAGALLARPLRAVLF